MIFLRKCFSKDVGEVLVCADVVDFQLTLDDAFSNGVECDIDVFNFSVKGRVLSENDSPVVVAHQW